MIYQLRVRFGAIILRSAYMLEDDVPRTYKLLKQLLPKDCEVWVDSFDRYGDLVATFSAKTQFGE